jgi:hypothetical protein
MEDNSKKLFWYDIKKKTHKILENDLKKKTHMLVKNDKHIFIKFWTTTCLGSLLLLDSDN